MRHWIAMASLCAMGITSMTGCVWEWGQDDYQDGYVDDGGYIPPPDSTTPAPDTCTLAATDGGNGGRGGLLSIRTTHPAVIDGLLLTDGGRPGEAGLSELGPEAVVGNEGDAGLLEVLEDPSFAFDVNWVELEEWIAIGLEFSDDIIAVGGTEANPTIAVGTLEVGPGATLVLSRYPTIYAYKVVIHEGGRLVLRDVGQALVATGEGSVGEDPGLNGGSVALWAGDMTVEGTIEVSGSDGITGAEGGLGGHLRIKAENLYVGTNGAILVGGGDGGDGADEMVCGADEAAP